MYVFGSLVKKHHFALDYLILKPSLLGGFKECDNWISLAKENGIKWWATSALEGNVGLNAIAQWVYTKNSKLKRNIFKKK